MHNIKYVTYLNKVCTCVFSSMHMSVNTYKLLSKTFIN